jgi:hypothetical protein
LEKEKKRAGEMKYRINEYPESRVQWYNCEGGYGLPEFFFLTFPLAISFPKFIASNIQNCRQFFKF